MKTFVSIFFVIASLLALGSCGRTDDPKPLSEIKNATTGDSLLYYYVQLRAYQYWQHATADTTLRSETDRKKFLQGIRDGFNAYKPGDTIYNDGRRLGFRFALSLYEFEQKYDIKLDPEVIFSSMAYGLRDGADIPELEYQKEFYRLLARLNAHDLDKKKMKARFTLKSEAKAHKLTKISDDLYYKITNQGVGAMAQKGDVVYVQVSYTRPNGDDLGMPSPEEVKVGSEGMPEVMTEAYSHLNKGATGVFVTYAWALFGDRAEIIGLHPDNVIMITITVKDVVRGSDIPEHLDIAS